MHSFFGGDLVRKSLFCKQLKSDAENAKRTLIVSLAFPVVSLFIIFAPKGLFLNFSFLGVRERFISPFFFVLLNGVVCYISGVGFFFDSQECRKRPAAIITEVYNGRILILTSIFFLHIWILLFFFSMALFVGGACICFAVLFSLLSVMSFAKVGKVTFICSLLLSFWEIYLLFLNIGILFI